MALLQAVNPDASMAATEDPMEFSAADSRTPMIEDDLDIEIDDGAPVAAHDLNMGEDEGGEHALDDEMGEDDGGAGGQAAGDGAQNGASNVPTAAAAAAETEGGGDSAKGTAAAEPTDDQNEDEDGPQEEDDEDEDGPQDDDQDDEDEDEDDDGPPPRRPAGKGPAGKGPGARAPQKVPATSAGGDVPDTTSQDSGDEDEDDDEENVTSAVNPTTEPSFTESAKNYSESDEESDAAEAGKVRNRPLYPEPLSDSESESLEDHGPVHPVVVDYQGSKISLFPPKEDEDEHESFLLQDEALSHEPLSRLLRECRHILRETVLDGEELELVIPCLGLTLTEQIAETMSTTMSELVDLFLQLSYNDGIGTPAAMRVVLGTKEKCHARVDYIRTLISEGKGLSHIYTNAPAPTKTAPPPPLIESKTPITAPEEFSTAAGKMPAATGLPANGTGANSFMPSDTQDFEDQFDVQTPGGEDTLGLGQGEDGDFLDFTSPAKMPKASDGAGASGFDGNFGGVGGEDFASADDFLNQPEDGAVVGGAFGGDLAASDFVEGFDATANDDSKAEGLLDFDAPPGKDAQAAEDAFTFIDTADDGETVAVGDGSEISGVKRGRDDEGDDGDDAKRARAE